MRRLDWQAVFAAAIVFGSTWSCGIRPSTVRRHEPLAGYMLPPEHGQRVEQSKNLGCEIWIVPWHGIDTSANTFVFKSKSAWIPFRQPEELIGRVFIRSKSQALSFVQFWTSAKAWAMGCTNQVELTDASLPQQVWSPKEMEMVKIAGGSTVNPGAVPRSWLAKYGIAPPVVFEEGDSFRVVRYLLIEGPDESTVNEVSETVGWNGSYDLRIVRRLGAPPPHGSWLRHPARF